MQIYFIGPVGEDIKSAINSIVGNSKDINNELPDLVVFDGSNEIDTESVKECIDLNRNIAIINAQSGQLSDVFSGMGCDVPTDLALFAVKRVAIPDTTQFHTIVTMVPHATAIMSGGAATDEDGSSLPSDQLQPAVSAETIANEIQHHVAQDILLDSNLIPPTGAFFGTVSYNFPWNMTITQNMWTEASGATQTGSSRTTLTYYIYFANGAGQAPQYVVVLVENGTVIPTANGTSALCSYDNGERAFALGTNTISNTVLSGSLSLVTQSPSATTTSPVTDAIDYQMTVMAQSGGGMVSTPFSATITTNTDNPDWGVSQAGNPAANEAAWMYYNITGWNASTQVPSNFGQWWAQMYGDSDSVNTLDSQCLNGASFHAVAAWTIPQNPNNQSLPVQMQYQNDLVFEGFVNCDNSGCGHHQIGYCTYNNTLSLPGWDLVAITGSHPDATGL